MRIIGCVNGFQDIDMLKHSLPALRKLVDVLVYVDGAYAKFPHDNPESTDDSLALAQEYADRIIFTHKDRSGQMLPWVDEIQKRNQYLIGESGDYYLVCDADEVPVGIEAFDRILLRSKPDWFVMLKRIGDNTKPYGIHRLFRHRPGIRYAGTHHAVHVGNHLIHPQKSGLEPYPGLVLNHLHLLRAQDRVQRKGVYQEEMKKDEAEFRAKERL